MLFYRLVIKRNNECIYTIGGLVEASDDFFFYEKDEKLLYIMYYSWPNINESHPLCKDYLSICVIENPCEAEAVVHVYRNKELDAVEKEWRK